MFDMVKVDCKHHSDKADLNAHCFVMSEGAYHELREEYVGLCIECGAERDGCEPDAERYECEECERPAVFGIEDLLICGLIEFE